MKISKRSRIGVMLLICICIAYSGWAQKGPYLSISSGYGMNMSSQTYSGNYSSTDNTYSAEQVYVSLGKGLNFGGAFGYWFNEHIGAELGVSYLLGNEISMSYKNTSQYYSYNYQNSISARMIQFKPTLIISSGIGKMKPYLKLGAVIGSGKITINTNSVSNYSYPNDPSQTNTSFQTIELNGGLSFGFNTALGIKIPLGEKVHLFGELDMINMSYAPTKGEITEARENGVNVLPDYSISYKQTEYVDSYTFSYSNPPNDYEPGKELKQKLPFGSIGFNIGISFTL